MNFEPTRLEVARRRRRLTITELAARLGVTPRTISGYITGTSKPGDQRIEEIAQVLGFPASYFGRPAARLPEIGDVSFRSFARMSAQTREAAVASAATARDLLDWASHYFVLPDVQIPELRTQTPADAASLVRAHWDIGDRPVGDMIALLEANGVRVFSLAEDSPELDAYSFWQDGTPFVFLNTRKSSERSRFDAAHELGHLVLHRHGMFMAGNQLNRFDEDYQPTESKRPNGSRREFESEADDFASAFLMPEASVKAHVRSMISLEVLISLKSVWGVSLAALVRRLKELGLISDWMYRELFVSLSQRGYRRVEPNSMQRELSTLWSTIFSTLRDEGMRTAKVADQLDVQLSELNAICFGLVMTRLPGDRDHYNGPRKLDGNPSMRLL